MTVDARSSQSGFTLVEMLVALAIFAMISVAGVALLQSASSSQLAVKKRLSALGDSTRAISILETDLAQAVARPVRNAFGSSNPAFVATGLEASGQIFALTRAGQANLDNAPTPELQRVAYVLKGRELRRVSWLMLDGSEPKPTVLLTNVASATTRFRDAEGNWRTDWDASDPFALPRALELEIAQGDAAPVRLLFLIGPGGTARPAQDKEGVDDDPA